jgi:hypothetical protein
MPWSTLTFVLVIQRIEGYDRLIVRWWWFPLAIAALMVLLALWKLTINFARYWKTPRSNPKRLFSQLCRVHSLSKAELALFRLLKERLPKEIDAAVLFVDPATWSWENMNQQGFGPSLEKLYVKIFGFPPDLPRR